jgi:hypothetical protein
MNTTISKTNLKFNNFLAIIKKEILSCIAFIFLIFFLTQEINSQVLWYANPDLSVRDNFRRLDPDGNKSPTGNSCVDNPNTPPTVTTPIDSEYGKFWRVTKPASRKRAELARTTGTRNSLTPQNGETYYYGWRWRINSSPDIIEDVTVFQWKTDEKGNKDSNKQHYPLNMEYNGSVLSFNAYGPAEPNWDRPGSISARKTTLWRKVIQENEWVSFVIKIKVDDSFDATNNRYNGYVEFWFNGVKQVLSNLDFNQYEAELDNANTTAYHRTFDGGEVYPKWGAYNENACDFEIVADFDEMRIATTFEDALAENSTDPSEPQGLEGTYKIKHSVTSKYWTVNNSNIITADEIIPNSTSQIFEVKSVGTAGYYNISSTNSNWDAVRFHSGNVYPTSTSTPTTDTNNTRIMAIILSEDGTYDIHTPQTTTGRYAYADLGDVKYLTSKGVQTKWILENQTALSLNENKLLDEFKMFPNPVKNTLNISSNNIKVDKVEVFNLSGKKMITKQINSGNEIKLNVSSLSIGIYFVKLYSTSAVFTKKMIK